MSEETAKKQSTLLMLLRDNDLGKSEQDKVIAFLNDEVDPDTLLDVTANNEILLRLSQTSYQAYWDKEIEKIPLDLEKEINLAKPAFLSSFEYILGYFQYMRLLVDTDNLPTAAQLLPIAVHQHSFHALNDWLGIIFESEGNLHQSYDKIESYTRLLENEAIWHGTPGFLLLAKLYFHLLMASLQTNADKPYRDEEKRNEDLRILDSLAMNIIKYLHMALVLEPQSIAEIHNSYLAKPLSFSDLSEFSSHTLRSSNPFGIASIAEMKAQASQLHPTYLLPDKMRTVERIAQEELHNNINIPYRRAQHRQQIEQRICDLQAQIQVSAGYTSFLENYPSANQPPVFSAETQWYPGFSTSAYTNPAGIAGSSKAVDSSQTTNHKAAIEARSSHYSTNERDPLFATHSSLSKKAIKDSDTEPHRVKTAKPS